MLSDPAPCHVSSLVAEDGSEHGEKSLVEFQHLADIRLDRFTRSPPQSVLSLFPSSTLGTDRVKVVVPLLLVGFVVIFLVFDLKVQKVRLERFGQYHVTSARISYSLHAIRNHCS